MGKFPSHVFSQWNKDPNYWYLKGKKSARGFWREYSLQNSYLREQKVNGLVKYSRIAFGTKGPYEMLGHEIDMAYVFPSHILRVQWMTVIDFKPPLHFLDKKVSFLKK